MITIQVETIDMHMARKLSGKNFFVSKDKVTATEKEFTLTTSAVEGFEHIEDKCIFIYAEEKSEIKESNNVTWACSLVDEKSNMLMLTTGEGEICKLTTILQVNLKKLIDFPNTTGQYIRFEYNNDQWEMTILPNFRSTEIMLRKLVKIKGKTDWNYEPVFVHHKYKMVIDFYSVVEHFREEVNKHYQALILI